MNPKLTEVELMRSPAWYPLRVASNDEMTMVNLDEEAYRAASFLDERILELRRPQAACELAILESAAAKLAQRSHYVFHTGHVGSTLVSRLIGAHEGFFSVREPALLRAIADAWTSRQASAALGPAALGPVNLRVALKLLARTWRATQRAVVKTTSFVSELAEPILADGGREAAIFMYTAPLNYLRSILGGPNSRVEAKALAPARLRRLVRRLGGAEWRANPRSEGEQIAMNWLCEMTALYQASRRFPARVLWVEFDAFLHEPHGGLEAIFRALGVAASAREIRTLAAGPIMRQYSKAPEYAYDAALRRDVLQSADWEHGLEIKRGMDWLGYVARTQPLAKAALESTAGVRAS